MVVTLALVGLSACSGSDASSDAAASTSPEETSDVRVDDGSIPDAANDSTDSASTDGSSPAPTDGSSTVEVDFCDAISAIQTARFELEETFGPEARRLFADVRSAAPTEVADDVATVVAALDALAEIGVTTEEDDPVAVDAAFEILLDPDYIDASENLVEYTSQECGIDLDDGDDADLDFEDLDGFDEATPNDEE